MYVDSFSKCDVLVIRQKPPDNETLVYKSLWTMYVDSFGKCDVLVIRRNSLTGCHVRRITSTSQAKLTVLVIRPFTPVNEYGQITN